MHHFRRKSIILTAVSVMLLVAGAVWLWRPPPPPPSPLSALAPSPDWSRLDAYQNSITRGEFEVLLTTVFTTGEGWRETIRIDDEGARIETGEVPPHASYRLAFRPAAAEPGPPRYWRGLDELRPGPPGKPLAGVRIAIDPGHIGGEWAVIEERNLAVGSNPPVREGDLTLTVAKLLKPRLEALGAAVSLVRDRAEPVTPHRPADYLEFAKQQLAAGGPGATGSPQRFAERLFYRTAEIRARAELVNNTLKPDLVLCLHFNADAWGSPANPLLVDRSHLHVLVNGGYGDDELRLADQRFAMLVKLLQGTHAEEVAVASAVARAMADATGLPPFTYSRGSATVRAIPGQPYVWARNLLANRLYECPVVFLEPYVMNARTDYARILAGDYEGLRECAGRRRPSIFREYADAVATGLANHFTRR